MGRRPERGEAMREVRLSGLQPCLIIRQVCVDLILQIIE